MGQVKAVRTVHAPVEAVWQCLNDIDHTPQWVTGLAAAEIKTPGDYGVGTVYHDTNRLGPMLQVTPWRITAFEPMSRQVHESESTTLPSTMILTLSPVPDGTQVEMVVHYRFLPRLGAVSRAFEGLVMNLLLKRVLTQNLTSLDGYLAGAQSDPAGHESR